MNFLKMFAGKEEPEFTVDEAIPFLVANGVDPETVGFQFWGYRNAVSLERYNHYFRKLRAYPVKTSDDITTEVAGLYTVQANCSYRGRDGVWNPGLPSTYEFRIRNGKLKENEVK